MRVGLSVSMLFVFLQLVNFSHNVGTSFLCWTTSRLWLENLMTSYNFTSIENSDLGPEADDFHNLIVSS